MRIFGGHGYGGHRHLHEFRLTNRSQFLLLTNHTLQAMTNDCDLNIGNNIRMRDTQFFGMLWPKTLENQMKCQ